MFTKRPFKETSPPSALRLKLGKGHLSANQKLQNLTAETLHCHMLNHCRKMSLSFLNFALFADYQRLRSFQRRMWYKGFNWVSRRPTLIIGVHLKRQATLHADVWISSSLWRKAKAANAKQCNSHKDLNFAVGSCSMQIMHFLNLRTSLRRSYSLSVYS